MRHWNQQFKQQGKMGVQAWNNLLLQVKGLISPPVECETLPLCSKTLFLLSSQNPIPTNKPGVEPKRPSRPVNITSICRLSPTVSNQISISWASEYGRVGQNLDLKLHLCKWQYCTGGCCDWLRYRGVLWLTVLYTGVLWLTVLYRRVLWLTVLYRGGCSDCTIQGGLCVCRSHGLVVLDALWLQSYCVAVYLVRRLNSGILLHRLKQHGIRHADHTRALSELSFCSWAYEMSFLRCHW